MALAPAAERRYARRFSALEMRMMRSIRFSMFLAAATLLAAACGGSNHHRATLAPGDPDAVVPELLRPQSLTIPANPLTGDAAPAEARSRAAVWRYALRPGAPVSAILILIPGTNGGASDFDYAAREILRRSNGAIEVWALDRRANLLEDLTGMEAAERDRDYREAIDYYLNGAMVDGRVFDGFLTNDDARYLSEFGLASVMADVRAAIDLIPASRRATNVFVGGHSLGAQQTLYYLSWDFDGDAATRADAGYASVAGAVLMEGTAFGSTTPEPQADYEADVRALRDGSEPVFGGFVGLSPAAVAMLEIEGMAAHPAFDDPADPNDGPEGEWIIPTLNLPPEVGLLLNFFVPADPLAALLGVGPDYRDFRLTNQAALGMVLDDNFQFFPALQASIGFISPSDAVSVRTILGQPLENLLGDALGARRSYGLTDTAPLYTWRDYDDVEGVALTSPVEERADITRLAESLWRGPTNYTEWYFAVRPSADGQAIGSLPTLDETSWQSMLHGLNGFHAARIDVPILALGGGSGLTPSPDDFERVRTTIADPDRAGLSRANAESFRVEIVPGANHQDVLVADDSVPGGNGFFGPMVDFMLAHATGTVTVDVEGVGAE
ncbi:MAG: hypothetical protein KC466_11240 [Myxococcales bacterium]|nr:hypothetical protein [Myxococcales bacterium]